MKQEQLYSLWLMPSGRLYNQLQSLISQLNKPYSIPVFQPHVTLVGSLSGPVETIIAQSTQLASLLKPYEIILQRVGYLNEYYRCLFVHVEPTESVMDAYKNAQGILNLPNKHYMPHLSIMYGSLPLNTKQKIIATIGQEFNIVFLASELHLFSTTGTPDNWFPVASFPFK